MKNKRGLRQVTSPFSRRQICSEVFLSLVIHHLDDFDALILIELLKKI